MLKAILLVGSGSFLGGVSRYLVSVLMKGNASGFPWATLTVNLLGCFIIGLAGGLIAKFSGPSNNWSLLAITGFCGSFTTFSTFAKDSVAMLQANNIAGFALYIAVSVIVGIALTAFGWWLVK